MKIAVISDTHGILREEVVSYIRECDVVFHAGDVTSERLGSQLRDIKRTIFVRGNCDEPWKQPLPYTVIREEGGFKFAMAHRSVDLPSVSNGYDIGIYGHTHCFDTYKDTNGRLFLNPGSCGILRYGATCSMAIIYIDETKHTYKVERIDIDPHGKLYDPVEEWHREHPEG